MKKFISLLGSLVLLPILSWAQAISLTEGIVPFFGDSNVICTRSDKQCVPDGDNTTCYSVCVSYFTLANLNNAFSAQSNRSSAIESSIASVRQDFRPIVDAQTTEINNLKSSISTAELQRMIQKAVREELNQRGL